MAPNENDRAIIINDSILIPSAQPCAYVPSKGDVGVVINNAFTPIEPFGVTPCANGSRSFPLLTAKARNSFDFPNGGTSSPTVATVSISPFDVTNNRAWVLDTTPHASATTEDKADPNYKQNPGLSLLSATHQDFDLTDFTDVDGVAYRWDFQPVCTELVWVKLSDIHGRFFVRHHDASVVYYSYNTTTWFTMPPAGVELIYNGTTTRTIYVKSPGQPATTANPSLTFQISFNAYGVIGMAPDSTTYYSVDIYRLRCAWPSPTLRAGQTKYSMYSGVETGLPIAQATVGAWAGTSPGCYLRSFPFRVVEGDAIVFTTASTATPYTRSSASQTQVIYYARDVQWIGLYVYFNVAATLGGAAIPPTNNGTYYFRAPFDTGNDYDGTPFIPSIGTLSGLLLIQGYKRGLQMSVTTDPTTLGTFNGVGGVPVVAKIGKVTATWDSEAKELTLSSPTPNALFRYSKESDPVLAAAISSYEGTSPAAYFRALTDPGLVNGDIIRFTGDVPLPWIREAFAGYEVRDVQEVGGAYYFNLSDSVGGAAVVPMESASSLTFDRTYSSALSVLGSDVVSFFAERGGSVASDSFVVAIQYADEAPPASFVTNFWSAPYVEPDNTTVETVVMFQRNPDWYCSPDGGGTGLTPDSPATLDYVCGDSVAWGVAYRSMTITFTWTAGSTKKFSLAAAGDVPSGYKLYYGLGVAPDTLYSVAVAVTTPTEIQYEIRLTDGTTKISEVFRTFVPGTGTTAITAEWDDVEKTLTLTGAPEDATILCDTTVNPTAEYLGPITVEKTSIYYIKMIYKTGQVIAYTDAKAVTEVDPTVTESFSTEYTLTWTTPAFTFVGIRAGDVVWACEGYYVPATPARYFRTKGDVILRGGFNSDFTERNTATYKSYINTTTTKRYNIYQDGSGSGMIDGFHADACTGYTTYYDSSPYRGPTWLFAGHHLKDCHVTIDESDLPGGTKNGGTAPQYRLGVFGGYYSGCTCHDCTCDISMTVLDGEDVVDPTLDGESGGSNFLALWIFASIDRSGGTPPFPFGCTATVSLNSGSGGDGGIGHVSPFLLRPGVGGSTSAQFYCYGAGTSTEIDFECVSGDVGTGGHYTDHVGDSAGSGNTSASCVMTVKGFSDVVGTVESGLGGSLSSGGDSIASLTSASFGTNISEEYTVTAGDAVAPFSLGSCQSKATISRTGGRTRSTSIMLVQSGEVGGSSVGSWSILHNGEIGYLPSSLDLTTINGGGCPGYDRTWISQTITPCFFDPNTLALSEATPTVGTGTSLSSTPVNAVRVNAITGQTTGWYSGTVNSNGAPLDGYETPKGTGVALGRYWE